MSANYLLSDEVVLLLAAGTIVSFCISPEQSIRWRWFIGLVWGSVAIEQIIRIAT